MTTTVLAKCVLTLFRQPKKSLNKSLTPHTCEMIKFFRYLFSPLIASTESIIFQNMHTCENFTLDLEYIHFYYETIQKLVTELE